MKSDLVLDIQNLSYSYAAGQSIFEKINFGVRTGEFAGLIGENGSGKSTLLKLIIGSLKLQLGNIKIFDQPLTDFDQYHKVGYLPQQLTFDTHFPTNVSEILNFYGYNKSDTEHRQILDRLGLYELFAHRLDQLSGGQRQRVYISLSLFTKPQLLLLDEPTVGVDTHYQKEFYEFLQYLNKQKGMAILLVSHDTDVLEYYADKIYCLGRFELHNLKHTHPHPPIDHIHTV
jgi:zinc transport system ATP-binding protein